MKARMLLRRLVPLGAMVAVLGAVPAAHASTATFADGTVTVTAGPGERNVVWIYGELDSKGDIVDEAGITAGEGCNQISPTQVECAPKQDGDFVTYGHYDQLVVELGDGDDEFRTSHTVPKVDVRGGDGNDTMSPSFAGSGIFDGGAGDDDIRGTDGEDRITGGPGNDTLNGDDGADIVDGGAGTDTMYGDNGLAGSNGNDQMLARDGERDTVSCELGADSVTADTVDVVDEATCESIAWPAADPADPDPADPNPGTPAACGSTPKVKNLKLKRARRLVKAGGCTVAVKRVRSRKFKKGRVVRAKRRGTVVTLHVSKGDKR